MNLLFLACATAVLLTWLAHVLVTVAWVVWVLLDISPRRPQHGADHDGNARGWDRGNQRSSHEN